MTSSHPLWWLVLLAGLARAVGVGAVTGTVRLRLDGEPVPGATVRFTAADGSGSWESVTDNRGQYALQLPTGTAVEDAGPEAAVLQLGLPFPNPFNPTTLIPVQVDETRRLRLTVFGILGQPVRALVDGELERGQYTIPWDGRDDAGRPVAAGVYVVRLTGPGWAMHGKVTLVDGVSGRAALPGGPMAAPAALAVAADDGLAYDVQVEGDALHPLAVAGVQPHSAGFDGTFLVEAEVLDAALPSGGAARLRGVPAGPFPMGSDLYDDERPPRIVHLSPYYLQELEVTVAEYGACVDAGACPPPATGRGCNRGKAERGDHPVNCISARDAERYCGWAGMRLPTEAEWEKAARGSGGRIYPWGDEPPGGEGNCDRAVMMRVGLGLGCGHGGTAPVGTRRRGSSPYGIEDLAGNVWEWTADAYDRTYYARAPAVDPANEDAGPYRAIRGNAWYYCDPDPDLRAANRYRLQPLRWNPYTGVRCARSQREPSPGGGPPRTAVEERALAQSAWMARNRVAREAEGDALPAGPPLPDQDMVRVPAGPFVMGSDAGGSDEGPARSVHVDAYFIDRYEVTVEAYAACVEAGACRASHTDPAAYSLAFEVHYLNGGRPQRQRHPVNGVSWHDAFEYCRWGGKRLPTEAEWEKAARGADGRTYPWGEEEPDCGRIVMDDGGDGCGHEMAWPVGSKPAGTSPYGACDLAGNLWEWVDDWYEHGYYGRAPDRNPHNQDPGAGHKVLRGGSMADQNPHIHRAANRLAYDPSQRFDYTIGFRCASDAGQ